MPAEPTMSSSPTTASRSGDGPDDIRLMSGYTSAYKRMDADLPAPALTRNLSYACSDQKLHPTEHRVLSLAEAMRLHTLDRYEYDWAGAGDGLIRLVIGESVPPLFFDLLGRHLIRLADPAAVMPTGKLAGRQLSLW